MKNENDPVHRTKMKKSVCTFDIGIHMKMSHLDRILSQLSLYW